MIETRVVPYISRPLQATFYRKEWRYNFGTKLYYEQPFEPTSWLPIGPLVATRGAAERQHL